MSTIGIYNPGPMREMPREDLDALRERCLERVGYNYGKAELLVAAYLRGRTEADENWRTRRAS